VKGSDLVDRLLLEEGHKEFMKNPALGRMIGDDIIQQGFNYSRRSNQSQP
jgi:hypothetical protein